MESRPRPTLATQACPSAMQLSSVDLGDHGLMPIVTGLKYWSDDVSSAHQAHPYAYYAGIYALLQVCALLSLLLLGIALLIVSVTRAGAHLHRDALETLTRAPLRFFTTTDNGVVTNLFSQDLNLVDTELPTAVLNTLFCVSASDLDTCTVPGGARKQATSSFARSGGLSLTREPCCRSFKPSDRRRLS